MEDLGVLQSPLGIPHHVLDNPSEEGSLLCFHNLTFHNLLKRTSIVLWGNTNVTNKLIVYSLTGGIYIKLLIFMYCWLLEDITKIINNYRSSEFFHFERVLCFVIISNLLHNMAFLGGSESYHVG